MHRLLIVVIMGALMGCGDKLTPTEEQVKKVEIWEKELRQAPAYSLIEFTVDVPIPAHGGTTRFALLCTQIRGDKELVYALVSHHTYCGNASRVSIRETAEKMKELTLPQEPNYNIRLPMVIKDAIGLEAWLKGHSEAYK